MKCVGSLATRSTTFWRAAGNEHQKWVWIYCEDERLSTRCGGREIWCLKPTLEALRSGQITATMFFELMSFCIALTTWAFNVPVDEYYRHFRRAGGGQNDMGRVHDHFDTPCIQIKAT